MSNQNIIHKISGCEKCPRNLNNQNKAVCEVYKAIKVYDELWKGKDNKTISKNYNKFKQAFKNYARAKQILKYEIGIYKELRQELKDGEINLVGIINDNWDASKSLADFKGNEVKTWIIKDELADGEAIQEYLYQDNF